MPASEELTLARPARWAARALAALIPLGLLIVPLACAPKLIDRFRIVKEAVLRGEALIGLLFVIAIIAFSGWSRVRELVANRALFAIAIAGIAWAAISTLA